GPLILNVGAIIEATFAVRAARTIQASDLRLPRRAVCEAPREVIILLLLRVAQTAIESEPTCHVPRDMREAGSGLGGHPVSEAGELQAGVADVLHVREHR